MATDSMSAPTYEMLWDCSACGTKGLLGVSHRRCPNCGAPQDPTTRYFPAPGSEVLAADHVYAGADWRCAGLKQADSQPRATARHSDTPSEVCSPCVKSHSS